VALKLTVPQVKNGAEYDVIETPTRSTIHPRRDSVHGMERFRDLSISDIAWRVNRQIFRRRFLLTTSGGEIRAVISERSD
jgi:hypothetical protein